VVNNGELVKFFNRAAADSRISWTSNGTDAPLAAEARLLPGKPVHPRHEDEYAGGTQEGDDRQMPRSRTPYGYFVDTLGPRLPRACFTGSDQRWTRRDGRGAIFNELDTRRAAQRSCRRRERSAVSNRTGIPFSSIVSPSSCSMSWR